MDDATILGAITCIYMLHDLLLTAQDKHSLSTIYPQSCSPKDAWIPMVFRGDGMENTAFLKDKEFNMMLRSCRFKRNGYYYT